MYYPSIYHSVRQRKFGEGGRRAPAPPSPSQLPPTIKQPLIVSNISSLVKGVADFLISVVNLELKQLVTYPFFIETCKQLELVQK